MKSIQVRDNLYKESKKGPLNKDLIALYNSYKVKISTLIKKTKENYFVKKINNNSDSNHLWNVAREYLSDNCAENKNSIKQINCNNTCLTESVDIANCFNEHFTNISKKLNLKANYNSSKRSNNLNFLSNIERNNKSIFLRATYEIEIENIIREFKNKNQLA